MKKLLLWAAGLMVVGLLALGLLVVLYPIPDANDVAIAEASEVFYADGATPIATFGAVKRTSVPLTEVPQFAQEAVLAAEDRRFYSHGAIDPIGIARAFVNNLRGGSTQGGSTITQQYVKNLYLTQDQTYLRKFQELIISIKIGFAKSKDEILEGYLNTIYWGRGAYGIEAASEAFFGHPASELTLDEAVMLAAMIQAPSALDPTKNPERLNQRIQYVTNGMVSEGWLTEAEAAAVVIPETLPPVSAESNRFGGQVGYIMQTVRRELETLGYEEAQIDGGGLRVITTIDEQGQRAAVATVERNGPKSGTEGLRIGIASIDPATGGIIAMYGGTDYVTNQLNNATQARGQGGSTFKPYALAAAFERGIGLDSTWNGNSPQTISGYTLRNEGNRSWGTVSLLQATENSINTPFVQLQNDVGTGRVIDAATRAGLPENTPGIERNLTFVLGTASPTPLELAATYATFAARGVYHEPTILQEVAVGGDVRYTLNRGGEARYASNIADNVNFALQRVVTNGTGARAQALGRPNAGKTGTTDENKSAWYAGYTPQMATAVMMVKEDADGNPVTLRGTGGQAKVFGSSFPLSLWIGFAQGYLAGKPVEQFQQPADLLGTVIPEETGEPEEEGATEEPTPEPTEEGPTPEPSPGPTEAPTPEPTEPEPTPDPPVAGDPVADPLDEPSLVGDP